MQIRSVANGKCQKISMDIKLPSFSKVGSDMVAIEHRKFAQINLNDLIVESIIESSYSNESLNVAVLFNRELQAKI
jgi:hypothetical protein